MMKKILVLLLSVVVLFLYFPIFCFVKEITVEGNAIVSVDEIKKTSELSGKLLAFHNKESSLEYIKLQLYHHIINNNKNPQQNPTGPPNKINPPIKSA